jgi:hypothetical protein
MSIGEIAAYVAEHLHQNGIGVVLTGGSCVSIYTDNRYQSYDLDFIEEGRSGRKKIAGVLTKLGFKERDRYFVHAETPFSVEFPAGPLAIGDEPVREVSELEFATGILRLLSATDCVKDRLAHYYHWKDRQCLDQAIMVAAVSEIDLEEIERWSRHEGMEDEFMRIRGSLEAKVKE